MSEENFGAATVLTDGADNSAQDDGTSGDGSNTGGGQEQGGGLSEENARFAATKGWNGPEDFDKALTSYRELETRFSKGEHKQSVPDGDDVSQEDWDKYARANGRPDSADAYEFTMPDLPENVVYNEQMADGFKSVAHKAALSPRQAKIVHDEMSKQLAQDQMAFFDNQAKSINGAHERLVTDWGDPSGARYQDGVKQAFASIKSQPGLLEAYVQSGILVKQGNGYAVTNADVVMAHANIGNHMLKEASGFDGLGGHAGGANPWEKGKENLTAQGQLVRSDPDQARALIRQSGKDPSAYGL